MSIRFIEGDCQVELPKLTERFHACVTDPPYLLNFMGRAWDKPDSAFHLQWTRAVYDCLYPGAHMLVFGGTRTWHRLACAIEDAGFEIRDTLMWVYGSGFPKSHNHLKPAYEPIILARKPPEGTVAQNVLKYGCGALNIDASRIPGSNGNGHWTHRREIGDGNIYGGGGKTNEDFGSINPSNGRWPSNLIHDGSEEVLKCFPETTSGELKPSHTFGPRTYTCIFSGLDSQRHPRTNFGGDSGSAGRLFYCAKADKHDRGGSKHPTVKPTDLMRYLIRLITPRKGIILDPFCGTGSTLLAADQLGFDAVGIDKDATYVADAKRKFVADAPLFNTQKVAT